MLINIAHILWQMKILLKRHHKPNQRKKCCVLIHMWIEPDDKAVLSSRSTNWWIQGCILALSECKTNRGSLILFQLQLVLVSQSQDTTHLCSVWYFEQILIIAHNCSFLVEIVSYLCFTQFLCVLTKSLCVLVFACLLAHTIAPFFFNTTCPWLSLVSSGFCIYL